MSETAEFLYKTTDYFARDFERCIYWNDPIIGIQWPGDIEPITSTKDRQGKSFSNAETFY